MAATDDRVEQLLIEDEMKEAYLTYAMSVIVSRALPDVRDGLKPSQRRILVAMNELNLGPRSKTRKCGKIVGDTTGNYHPHGEVAIYDTLVRMAQPFSFRYPLVYPQGNFGAQDGDPPAAMRYTEARLSAVGAELLDDLGLDTVDFRDNYDNTRLEPEVLPAKFPNLLANGASGIAVGMATSIPPHNIGEVCEAAVKLIDNPDVSVREIMEVLPGPDFPTGGIICGSSGIYDGYSKGRGIITIRARTHFEEGKKGQKRVVATEIPYRLTRDRLVEKIAEAVRSGAIRDVSDIRNESDRSGTRIVVELKRGGDENVVLNQLFQHTPLQTTVSIINIAIQNAQPKTFTIKELLQAYVDHREDVVRRRTCHLLAKAEARAHILEGLKIALLNIDQIIAIIRKSKEAAEAREKLMKKFKLSKFQADAILAMQLRALVGLERLKVEQEHGALMEKIEDYQRILGDRNLLLDIIREDLYELKEKYGSDRRTDISGEAEILGREDLIPEEEVAVIISHSGYVKRMPLDTFRAQGRGGKGVIGADLKESDFVRDMFVASTHDYILFFTSFGLTYWLKVFEIPEMQRTGRGRALVNILRLREGENITGLIPVREFDKDYYLLMATAGGAIKKTSLAAFGRRGSGGIISLKLAEGDRLIGVRKTDGKQQVILGTRTGMSIRFHEKGVREMGRSAAGVKGIRLRDGDEVVDMALVSDEAALLTVCENGYGKRTVFAQYPLQKRGGVGVVNIKTTKRNGPVIAVREVDTTQELMIITSAGMMVKIPMKSIRCISRNTGGVKLITTDKGDTVSSVAPVATKVPESAKKTPATTALEKPAKKAKKAKKAAKKPAAKAAGKPAKKAKKTSSRKPFKRPAGTARRKKRRAK